MTLTLRHLTTSCLPCTACSLKLILDCRVDCGWRLHRAHKGFPLQAAQESSRQEVQTEQDALAVAAQVKVDLQKAQAALHEEVPFLDVLPFQVFSPNICKQMAGDFPTDHQMVSA